MPKKLTTLDFINRANQIHGTTYNYDLVVYKNSHTKVTIICPHHGQFQQMPYCHVLLKQGCMKCGGKQSLTTQQFIQKAQQVHGTKYVYENTSYVSNKTKVDIGCPVHGIYRQRPNDHLNGLGCLECCGRRKLTTQEFINQAKKLHIDKYDYSKVVYKNDHEKVVIVCPKHGDFFQSPGKHKLSMGCPACNESSGEQIISHFLTTNNIAFKSQHTFDDCLNQKTQKPLRFDFFLLNQNTVIEYDGEQHTKLIKLWHKNLDGFKQSQHRDYVKSAYCARRQITLIRIDHKHINRIPHILADITTRRE